MGGLASVEACVLSETIRIERIHDI